MSCLPFFKGGNLVGEESASYEHQSRPIVIRHQCPTNGRQTSQTKSYSIFHSRIFQRHKKIAEYGISSPIPLQENTSCPHDFKLQQAANQSAAEVIEDRHDREVTMIVTDRSMSHNDEQHTSAAQESSHEQRLRPKKSATSIYTKVWSPPPLP